MGILADSNFVSGFFLAGRNAAGVSFFGFFPLAPLRARSTP